MNLILFEQEELNPDARIFIDSSDGRIAHLKNILKVKKGDKIAAGIVNGSKGSAEITEISKKGMSFIFNPDGDPAGLHPLTIILGLSRPPTIKKVLKEATALGVKSFILCGTENGEKSYQSSSALKPERIREVLIEGVQQAACTMIPQTRVEHSLRCAIDSIKLPQPGTILLALDNYEAEMSLTEYWKHQKEEVIETVLAIGSERGWTDIERRRLKDAGFKLCSLGPRILRTETASIAGAAVCLSGMGLI